MTRLQLDRRARRRGLILPLLCAAVVASAGCRTRLLEPWEEQGYVPLDFSTSDRSSGADSPAWPGDAGPLDLLVDLATPDLAVPPDLRPPPDLTLPPVCRDIFVVDKGRRFSSFDTETATFTDLRYLPRSNGADPQSMAVRRDGYAHVIYDNGDILRVDTEALDVTPTGFDRHQVAADGDFFQAGAAFSADQPGGASETFYINLTGEGLLARIDQSTWIVERLAVLGGSAELTGTSDAELWGFFPGNPSYLARIDKVTAARDRQVELPEVRSATTSAYAFAFWGGAFWIFHEQQGATTDVYRMDRQSGEVRQVLAGTGRHIVGAGASSCAPIGLD